VKIQVNKRAHVGVPLCDVPFGSVVTRPVAEVTYYIVTSPMDGSGRKRLVTLSGGVFKELPQDTAVILVNDAMLVIGGADTQREGVSSYERNVLPQQLEAWSIDRSIDSYEMRGEPPLSMLLKRAAAALRKL
jgi:hypothetical protein